MSHVTGLSSIRPKESHSLSSEEAFGPFKDIPEDLIFYIFSHFEPKDLHHIASLNKSWRVLFKKNETTRIHAFIESIADQVKTRYPNVAHELQTLSVTKSTPSNKYKQLIRILKKLDFKDICLLNLEHLSKSLGFVHFHHRMILCKLLEFIKKFPFCFNLYNQTQHEEIIVLMICSALILKKTVENKDFKNLPANLREMVLFLDNPSLYHPQHEFFVLFKDFIDDYQIVRPICPNEEEQAIHLHSATNRHLVDDLSFISSDCLGDVLITLIHFRFHQQALSLLNSITTKQFEMRLEELNTGYANDYLTNKIIESAVHLAEVNEINALTTFLCFINDECITFNSLLKSANKLIELNKTNKAFKLIFTIYILEKDYDDFEIIKKLLIDLQHPKQPFRLASESPYPHLEDKWKKYKELLEETLT